MKWLKFTYCLLGEFTFGKTGSRIVNFASMIFSFYLFIFICILILKLYQLTYSLVVISSQIGFCCAYIMFIAQNLNLYVYFFYFFIFYYIITDDFNLFVNCRIFKSIKPQYFSLMYFPIFMVLSWLRDIK